jgi:hypothetical protein
MTCKIRDGIALSLPINLRRCMGHCHGAAQEPRCLPDKRRLKRSAIAFRLRVEHQQVFHHRSSPHHCHLNIPAFIHYVLMFIAMITDLMSMSIHLPLSSMPQGVTAAHTPSPMHVIVDQGGGLLNWEPS